MSQAPLELTAEQQIRADSLSHAMDLIRQRGLAAATAPDVLKAAEQFYNYLNDGTVSFEGNP